MFKNQNAQRWLANSFGQTADPHNQLKLLEDEIESEFGKRANLVRTDGGKDPSYSEVLKKREGSQSNEGQSQTPQEPVGPFEEHTKGIGRKILESKGWEDGKGLGNGRKEGIREAITGGEVETSQPFLHEKHRSCAPILMKF